MKRWNGMVVVGGLTLALAAGMAADAAGLQDQTEVLYRAQSEAERSRSDLEYALQEDPANDLYRSGRSALRDRDYRQAAEYFEQIRGLYAQSGYVPDSYYYEAYSRQRMGGERELRRALELLYEQMSLYAEATTHSDAEALTARIEAQLAQRGDADSWFSTQDRAAQECGEQDAVRMAALSALINMDPDRARPILMEVLGSKDLCSSELRAQAIFLLSQDMTPEVLAVLMDLAVGDPDPDPEVRSQAVFWLGQSDSPEATAALRSVLEDSPDAELQGAALFALSQTEGDASLDILMDYASRTDVDPEVRGNAIFYISQHPSPETSALLRQLYSTVGRELQEQVLFALSQHSDPANQAFLRERALDPQEDSETRKNALFWLAQTGDGLSLEELTEIYDSTTDPEIKEHLLFIASQMSGAVELLLRIAGDESAPELQEQAVFWLGQSNDPRAAEFLLELIRR